MRITALAGRSLPVIDRVERKDHPHCYCDAATLVGLLAGFDLLTLSQQLQER